MLPHALDATANGPTQLYIHTPDKDVLVLPERRYPDLCLKISFVAGMGDNHRMIGLGSIPKLLWKPWNRSASPRRDIGPCGEIYMPALSPWNGYLTRN